MTATDFLDATNPPAQNASDFLDAPVGVISQKKSPSASDFLDAPLPMTDEENKSFIADIRAGDRKQAALSQPFAEVQPDGTVKQRLPGNDPEGNAEEFLSGPGRAMTYAGNVARAIPADVAAGMRADPSVSGNIPAAVTGQPLPVDAQLKLASEDSPVAATVGKVSQGLAATAPLAVVGALPTWGAKLVAAGFSTQMIAAAPKLARDLGTELGKNPEDRDTDKLTSLISDAIQTGVFAPLAGAHSAGDFLESKLDPTTYVARQLATQLKTAKLPDMQQPSNVKLAPLTAAPFPDSPDVTTKQPITPNQNENIEPETTDTAEPAKPFVPGGPGATGEQTANEVQPGEETGEVAEPLRQPSPGPAAGLPNVTGEPPVAMIPVKVSDDDVAAMSQAQERPPDVLDDIENITRQPVKFSEPDYAGTIADARTATFTQAGRPSAATGRLDKRISASDGEPADKVLQGLAAGNSKYADWTRDDLAQAIIQAHQVRENPPIDLNARVATEQQARDNLFNQANSPKRPGVESVPVEQTQIGDTFTLNGHPMAVVDHPLDADTGKVSGVKLTGAYGTQNLPIGAKIHMDAGSLKEDINGGALGRFGMGAAKVGEDKPLPLKTNIANAQVDASRQARGLPPILSRARGSNAEMWDRTMQRIEDDPEWPARVLAEVSHNARVLTPEETLAMDRQYVMLQNEFEQTTRDLLQARDDAKQFPNRQDAVGELTLKQAKLSDEMQEFEHAMRDVGSEWGASGQIRQRMMREDYSLAAMTTKARAAKGQALTPEEMDQIHKAQAAEMDTRRRYEELQKQVEDERAQRMVDDEIAARLDQVTKAPGYDRQVSSLADRIVTALEAEAVKARARLKEKLSRLNAGVDPTLITDLATVGAAHIARGTLDFTRWSKAMVADFGENVIPWLNQAWTKANARVDTAVDRLSKGKQSIAVKQRIRKDDISGNRENIIASLKNASEQKRPLEEQGDYIRKLMENFIQSGIKTREPLVDAVHDVLTNTVKLDVTRRDTMEAMSNYGRFKALNPDEIKAQRRDLSHQIAQTLKLSDIEARRPLPRSGVEQHTPSTEGRLLEQQVNEAKRRYGVVTDDPAKQLKSALDARKTWLNNRIADVKFQLAKGERFVKTKTPGPEDAETTRLKMELHDLSKQLDDVAPKPGITDAQRAAAAERSVARENEFLEKQIAAGEVSLKSYRPQITTPKLDALRARRDALRAQRDELRETNVAYQRQQAEANLKRQKTALENAIVEKQKQLAAGPRPPAGRAMNRPADPALERLIQQRDALTRQLADMNRGPKKSPEEVALKSYLARLTASNAHLADRMARGDFAPKPRRTWAWQTDPKVLAAKAANQAIRNDFDRAVMKARLNQRGLWAKGWDGLAKWKRAFVLSWPTVLAKLTSAATQSMAYAPFEEAAGSLSRRMFPAIAEQSPRHGSGFNLRAEVQAISDTITHLVKDFNSARRTGRTDLDLLHGKPVLMPPELKDMVGNFHYALKTPLMRNEFARSYSKLMQAEAAKGVDVTEPLVQQRIGNQAYQLAQKAIFKENNLVTRMYSRALSATRDQVDGKQTRTGKMVESVLKFTFPVVDIPTTIVKRTFEYSLGLPLGLGRAGLAYAKGIENLKPDEAEAIMRNLKRGKLGAAVLLIGFFNPQMFGGFYQPGEKRPASDIKPGAGRIGGHNISHLLFDTPLAQQLQIGATIRRVADEQMSKSNPQKKGIGTGVWAALLGLVDEVPFMGGIKPIVDNPTPTSVLGGYAKSAIPGALQFTASELDRDKNGDTIRRKPTTILQTVETGIPGLRQNVPARVTPEAQKAVSQAMKLMTLPHMPANARTLIRSQMQQNYLKQSVPTNSILSRMGIIK